jgi:ribosomal protein S18 acetylase RimI-like enzyme
MKITTNTHIFNQNEQDCVLDQWHDYIDKGSRSSYTFLVYRKEDHVLGYACYGPHALAQGTYDLYWIAVDPASQGKGIGQALLTKVEQHVADQGGRMMVIETSSGGGYRAARRFYQHNGYRRVTRIPDFYAPGDDLLIYYKLINVSIAQIGAEVQKTAQKKNFNN